MALHAPVHGHSLSTATCYDPAAKEVERAMPGRRTGRPVGHRELILRCSGCSSGAIHRFKSLRDDQELRCSACGRELGRVHRSIGGIAVLSKSSVPGVVRVYCTRHAAEDIIETIRRRGAASGPASICLEAYFSTPTPELHEARIHERLQEHRVQDQYFRIDLDVALAVLRQVIGTSPIRFRPPASQRRSGRMRRVYSCRVYGHLWSGVLGAAPAACTLCHATTVVCLREEPTSAA